MRRCLTLLVTREMQIKATVNQTKYRYTPSTMAAVRNTGNTKCWRKCGETVALKHLSTLKSAACFSYFEKQLAVYEVRHTPASWSVSSFLFT